MHAEAPQRPSSCTTTLFYLHHHIPRLPFIYLCQKLKMVGKKISFWPTCKHPLKAVPTIKCNAPPQRRSHFPFTVLFLSSFTMLFHCAIVVFLLVVVSQWKSIRNQPGSKERKPSNESKDTNTRKGKEWRETKQNSQKERERWREWEEERMKEMRFWVSGILGF